MPDQDQIPLAQHLDYAPPPARRGFPWLMFFSAPVLGAAAWCLVVASSPRMTDPVVFGAFGVGLGVCGAIWFWIGVRRR